jgi:hypothetical protein
VVRELRTLRFDVRHAPQAMDFFIARMGMRVAMLFSHHPGQNMVNIYYSRNRKLSENGMSLLI